jgi:hypothetical protein
MSILEFHHNVATIALRAADAVEAELVAAGLQAERKDKTGGLADLFPGMGDEMADWTVTRSDGNKMQLQMAYIDRCNPPVTMDVGPVLDLEDVLGSKVCALASRVATRDYIDTAAALRRYSVEELIAFAQRLDSGLSHRDFADAGRRLDDMPDERFAAYGLTSEEIVGLRDQLATWPRS